MIIVFVSLGLLIEFAGGVLKNPPPPLPLLVLNILLSLLFVGFFVDDGVPTCASGRSHGKNGTFEVFWSCVVLDLKDWLVCKVVLLAGFEFNFAPSGKSSNLSSFFWRKSLLLLLLLLFFDVDLSEFPNSLSRRSFLPVFELWFEKRSSSRG